MATGNLKKPRWPLAFYGGFGSLLPQIVSIGQKTDTFTFSVRPEVVVATLIYVASAALLAAIYPYNRATQFKATLVGILFPTIVGSALGIAQHTLPNLPTYRGGDATSISSATADWVDAFSLF
jgi:hypothetical protein